MTIVAANLIWYYSGGASNSNPAASIGGAKSSVPLSTTELHNLFDDVTGEETAAGADEYRLLYFQNTDPDLNGLITPVVWFTALPFETVVEVGVAAAGKNAVETAIADAYTAPVGVTFSTPEDSASGLALPSGPYLEDDYVGVWFHRAVSPPARSVYGEITAWVLMGDTV